MTQRPVNDRGHFIVNAERIGDAKQGVTGRFCPHDETPRNAFRIADESGGKKAHNFLLVEVVGVAERAIHVETESLNTGNIKRHDGYCTVLSMLYFAAMAGISEYLER